MLIYLAYCVCLGLYVVCVLAPRIKCVGVIYGVSPFLSVAKYILLLFTEESKNVYIERKYI